MQLDDTQVVVVVVVVVVVAVQWPPSLSSILSLSSKILYEKIVSCVRNVCPTDVNVNTCSKE
jgi:hypothetical protein